MARAPFLDATPLRANQRESPDGVPQPQLAQEWRKIALLGGMLQTVKRVGTHDVLVPRDRNQRFLQDAPRTIRHEMVLG